VGLLMMIKFKVVYINSMSNSLRGIGPSSWSVDRLIVVQFGGDGEMGVGARLDSLGVRAIACPTRSLTLLGTDWSACGARKERSTLFK
jgi:hypothetical protein